jgi:predicted nucleic acid-binding protein
MKALDTNILARYLLGDDMPQAEAAARLLESGERWFVPVTSGAGAGLGAAVGRRGQG